MNRHPLYHLFLLLVIPLLLAGLACGGGSEPAATPAAATAISPDATSQTNPAGNPPAGISGVVVTQPGQEGNLGYYASLALDANNDPIIAYVFFDTNSDGAWEDTLLYVVRWDRAQAGWAAPVVVATVGNIENASVKQIGLARDASTNNLGLVYVVAGQGLWLAQSADGGATWISEQLPLPTDHTLSGPGIALANGITHLAVTDQSDGRLIYLSRTGTSGSFQSAAAPQLGNSGGPYQKSQAALALDSSGRPGLAYWLTPAEAYNSLAAFWRPDEAGAYQVSDTNGWQNDFANIVLAFNGTQPVIVLEAVRDESATTLWTVRSADGVNWEAPTPIAADGGQIMGLPLSLVYTNQGQAALAAGVTGGNLSGTQCGRPKLARSADLINWQTCSPDPSQERTADIAAYYLQLVSGSDGKLAMVFQNANVGVTVPAGVIFWREP